MTAKCLASLCGILLVSCSTPQLDRKSFPDIYGLARHGGFAGYFDTRVRNIHTGNRDSREWSADSYANYILRKFNGQVTVNALPANPSYLGSPVGPLHWNGRQVWKIRDEEGLGSFEDTIIAPNIFSITSPTQVRDHDSVSMIAGFTINYTSPNSDSVFIEIESENLLSHSFDSTIPLRDTIWIMRTPLMPATGNYFVRPDSLLKMPKKGIVKVCVIAPKVKVVEHWHKYYALRAISEAETQSWVKP